MNVVPAAAVEMLAGLFTVDELSQLAGCGRQVGRRVELDVDAARTAVGRERAELLVSYWEAACRFADQQVGSYVDVERDLVAVRQADKVDLIVEYEALVGLPVVGELVEALCDRDADADADRLCQLWATLSLSCQSDDTWTVWRFEVAEPMVWPAELGGSRHPFECRRKVELSVSYAKWRDRRVRRLGAVRVAACERWPDPAPWLPESGE